MKILLIFLSAFLVSVTSVHAQDKKISEGLKKELKQNFEESAKRLKLSDKQRQSFWAVTSKYFGKMIAVKESDAGPMDKLKTAMELLDKKNNEIKPILTEAQYKMYLQIQDEKIQKAKEKMKG